MPFYFYIFKFNFNYPRKNFLNNFEIINFVSFCWKSTSTTSMYARFFRILIEINTISQLGQFTWIIMARCIMPPYFQLWWNYHKHLLWTKNAKCILHINTYFPNVYVCITLQISVCNKFIMIQLIEQSALILSI